MKKAVLGPVDGSRTGVIGAVSKIREAAARADGDRAILDTRVRRVETALRGNGGPGLFAAIEQTNRRLDGVESAMAGVTYWLKKGVAGLAFGVLVIIALGFAKGRAPTAKDIAAAFLESSGVTVDAVAPAPADTVATPRGN